MGICHPATPPPVTEVPGAMYDPSFPPPPEIEPLSVAAAARKTAISGVAKMKLDDVKTVLANDFAYRSVEYSAANALR